MPQPDDILTIQWTATPHAVGAQVTLPCGCTAHSTRTAADLAGEDAAAVAAMLGVFLLVECLGELLEDHDPEALDHAVATELIARTRIIRRAWESHYQMWQSLPREVVS